MKVRVYHDGLHEASGALETLLSRLCPQIATCDFKSSIRLRSRQHGKGAGYVKKAAAAVAEAREEGFDAVVFLIDEDGDPERSQQMSAAQEGYSGDAVFPRAFGVAIRSFDAWMVADEAAMAKALARTIDCQKSPEELKSPKEVARSIVAESMSLREFYAEVSRWVRIDHLEDRCPAGFAPFAQRVRSLLAG